MPTVPEMAKMNTTKMTTSTTKMTTSKIMLKDTTTFGLVSLRKK